RPRRTRCGFSAWTTPANCPICPVCYPQEGSPNFPRVLKRRWVRFNTEARTGGPGVLPERKNPDDTRVQKGAPCRPRNALRGDGERARAGAHARVAAAVGVAATRAGLRSVA